MKNCEVTKMIKNYDVAKDFANGESDIEGNNMFSEGNTIYSYGHHFPIAVKVRVLGGGKVALFNPNSYSNSTAKHKGYVESALSNNGYKLIRVIGCNLERVEEQIETNKKEMAELTDKLTRVRSPDVEQGYKRRIEQLKEDNDFLMDYALKRAI